MWGSKIVNTYFTTVVFLYLGKFGFGQNIRDKFGNFTLLLDYLGVIFLAKCYEAFFFYLILNIIFFEFNGK